MLKLLKETTNFMVYSHILKQEVNCFIAVKKVLKRKIKKTHLESLKLSTFTLP